MIEISARLSYHTIIPIRWLRHRLVGIVGDKGVPQDDFGQDVSVERTSHIFGIIISCTHLVRSAKEMT